MSLRRNSCNACYRGKRKCDLTYPTCQRCQKSGKTCEYVSRPTNVALNQSITAKASGETTTASSIPKHLCTELANELEGLLPAHDDWHSWQWIAGQLYESLVHFTKFGENLFIHKSIYATQPQPAIKTAFDICTASRTVTPATRADVSGMLESEISTLISNMEVADVREGLARLQSMVLYQILRLVFRDSKQEIAAEQRKTALNTWTEQITQQIRPDSLPRRTYQDLILAESVRRTVIVMYSVHAAISMLEHRTSADLPTLALLPVSIDPEAWASSDVPWALSAESDLGTMGLCEWTEMWTAFPPRPRLDPFQKMLMVACKGKSKVDELQAEDIA